MRRRAWALVAVVCVVAAGVLGACGSDDNGGVIEGPTATTSLAPGSTSGGSTATSAPGY